MNKNVIFILLAIQLSFAQTISTARRVDWTLAGNKSFVEPSTIINFQMSGGDNTGATNSDAAMSTILSSIGNSGAIIYFPAGTYLFNQRIILKTNVILRGESANTTFLKFDLGGVNNAIQIQGTQTSTETSLTQTASIATNSIQVTNSSLFQVGDFVKLSDDDTAKVTSTWAIGSTGQILKISSINSNQITFSSPLRRDYLIVNLPKVTKLNMLKNVGVENLSIERLDATASQTSNININRAFDVKVSCVKSIKTNFAHVSVDNATNVVVEGSYFQDGLDYGNDGKAYGVVLQNTSGECLIYNNIFSHLRHSVLLQAGSNGNVISYNYSRDPYWTGVSLPSNSAGDLVLHGNYPYANLFEGNIVQNVVIDDSHGSNGPYNTFHRNRAELYGIFMNNNPASNNQNFSSNEITNTGFLLGNYTLSGSGHYQYNNNKNGTILPSGTTALTPNSYYLNNMLTYYLSNSIWPPIGNASNYNNYLNESKQRYLNNQLTRCSSNETLTSLDFDNSIEVIIFPNPVNDYLTIMSEYQISKIELFNVNGKFIKQLKIIENLNNFNVDLGDLMNGIYFIKIYDNEGENTIKKIIKE
ncbi:T9SS type A sorting domain-containing protein [Flavobacterium proteolyticum]|uniref:T9SS type A sorting domain-containing protein n=1 Tax=Flavobacterium proteolyticum TaxID=2911683 RepID=A0ABR9WME6_9FLAO|nr:T9SS type A sorting domain-containing protein [Flavobacterium proteolyticum]MBE9575090.1 T9SS type A sorting domain-containing protein [Flavobacterium proteolyticum]